MGNQYILETERTLIREFVESDAEAFFRLGSDPRITRFTHDPDGGFADVDHARDILCSHVFEDYRRHGFGRWACVLRASEDVIGFVGLKRLPDIGEVDLGYRLLPEHWGQGLATESARAVLDYGLSQLGLDRIVAFADPENLGSTRVLAKVGMRCEGEVDYDGLSVLRYATGAPRPHADS
jgi:RimJ/RimL family protein N-acetyltransferase